MVKIDFLLLVRKKLFQFKLTIFFQIRNFFNYHVWLSDALQGMFWLPSSETDAFFELYGLKLV